MYMIMSKKAQIVGDVCITRSTAGEGTKRLQRPLRHASGFLALALTETKPTVVHFREVIHVFSLGDQNLLGIFPLMAPPQAPISEDVHHCLAVWHY